MSSITIKLNNGESKALEEIQKKWHFKDFISIINFGLATLSCSNGKLWVLDENGTQVAVEPSEKILKPKKW